MTPAPRGARFVEMIEAVGDWDRIESRPVMFGVNYIYVASKAQAWTTGPGTNCQKLIRRA